MQVPHRKKASEIQRIMGLQEQIHSGSSLQNALESIIELVFLRPEELHRDGVTRHEKQPSLQPDRIVCVQTNPRGKVPMYIRFSKFIAQTNDAARLSRRFVFLLTLASVFSRQHPRDAEPQTRCDSEQTIILCLSPT